MNNICNGPKSRIINEEIMDSIKLLPIPCDIVNEILNYLEVILNPQKLHDIFWINFGIETCNLYKWNLDCLEILSNTIEKNNYFALLKISGLFCKLIDNLDALVCLYYPINKYSITINKNDAEQINSSQIKMISFENQFEKFGYQLPITCIFYNCSTITKYERQIEDKNGNTQINVDKNIIPFRDKYYITNFIFRFGIYLIYLEEKIDSFPVYLKENQDNNMYSNKHKSNIKKFVQLLKHHYYKLEL